MFNYNENEYQEIKRDFKECKETVDKLELFLKSLVEGFKSEYYFEQ